MNRPKVLLTSLVFFLTLFCIAQNSTSYEVVFEPQRNWDKADSSIVELMQYRNTATICFGLYYIADSVSVFSNDTCLYKNIINSDVSTGRVRTNITIKRGKENLMRITFANVEVLFPYDSRFLFLQIDKIDGKIKLIYSNNPPRYR